MKILAWPGERAPEMNPYTRLLYRHVREARGDIEVGEFSSREFLRRDTRWDVWHVHWPEALVNIPNPFRMAAEVGHFMLFVTLAKLRGMRLVWTIHDLETHARRRPRLEAWFKRWFIRRLDGAVALTPGGAVAARRRYPGLRATKLVTISHGSFVDAYPNTVSREAARERLGLPREVRVLLFFGTIRPYKNVPELIRVFRALPGPDLRLLVVGDPESDRLRREVERLADADVRVHLQLRAVETGEVQLFMNASNLVVLPFQRIQNSGSLILALSFLRPVLAPALGAVSELQELVGDEFLMTYQGDLAPENLAAALDRIPADGRGADRLARVLHERMDWRSIAKATIDFFEDLCAEGR